MTPNEKLRIAVAKADGWKQHSEDDSLWVRPGMQENALSANTCLIPDYTTDRNDIIGAIARMSEEEQCALSHHLWRRALDEDGDVSVHECLAILIAEPETLCRLYLKAKGITFE